MQGGNIMIYMDNAATTKMHPDVVRAMLPYMGNRYGNPSGIYTFSKNIKKDITQARELLASTIGAGPDEIFFTSGGSESDNWALKMAAQEHPYGSIITTPIEHHAILRTCDSLEKRHCRIIKCILSGVVCALLLPVSMQAQKNTAFIPGQVWNDTDGNPINAHGGGLLYHNGTYYWYGEYKKGKTILPDWATWECYRTDVTGVGCYSSKDLLNWKFEGIVLPAVKDDPNHDLHPSKVLERPKVIFNKKTGKFVMWAHVESADYSKACAGVAVADSPVGPFVYQGSFRPNNAMSRDQTVFVDDDGRAYQFYSSENNETMYISLLTDDYLKPSGRFTRNFVKESREAPAVFKYNGKYYMLSSGCTGWDPNVAEIAVADSIMGTWKTIGNPCTGPDADKTFYAQSTYVQPVIGKKDAYIAMFDRWKKKDLEDSRYVWLPVLVKDGKITIPWHEKWTLSIFDK